jgi:hypothetical protein
MNITNEDLIMKFRKEIDDLKSSSSLSYQKGATGTVTTDPVITNIQSVPSPTIQAFSSFSADYEENSQANINTASRHEDTSSDLPAVSEDSVDVMKGKLKSLKNELKDSEGLYSEASKVITILS